MNDPFNMYPAMVMDPKFSSLQMGVLMGTIQVYAMDEVPQAIFDAVRGIADENNQ